MALTRITKGVIKPNENYDTHNIVSTGIVTSVGLDVNGNADVSGSLSVGGVLTYEDVTSIDSVGIITARSGLVSPYADIDDFVSVGSNIHLGNAGVVTATSFVGDGSGLIGVASTDNIVTGTAATFNTYPVDINAGMTVAGVSTFQDIDVDGHTNLDNVNIAGVSTFASNVYLGDNDRLYFGDDNDLQIWHASTYDFINASGNAGFFIRGTNNTTLQQPQLNIRNDANTEDIAKFIQNGAVELYHNNAKKLETTSAGVLINGAAWLQNNGTNITANGLGVDASIFHNGDENTGIDFASSNDQINFRTSGTVRATVQNNGLSVVGVMSALNATISGDLDVDGHTNLDNVSIAGVSTFSDVVGITSSLNVTGITSISSQYSLQPFTVIGGSHPTPGYHHRNQFVFKTSHGHTDLKFENSYGGNWYGGSVSHTRILWEAYGERNNAVPGGDYGKLGEFCSIQPKNNTGGAFTYLDFKGNDGVVGLSTMCRMYTNQLSFHIHGNTTTRVDQVGLGITGNIYHLNDWNSGYTAYDTYFGFPQNNQFHLVCNGTEKFRVDSNWARFQNLSQGLIINSDLDVDGHTNLDNVSIAGVTTFTGALSVNGDAQFTGGASAVSIAGGSDIRLSNGSWTGNSGSTAKIQCHDNKLYIVGGTGGIIFREDGTDRWFIDGNGHFGVNTDSTYDIGTNSTRVRNIYADTLYGDGSNLTGVTQTTINSNTNNYVITGTGTANTLQGESTLTFDGTKLESPRIDCKGLLHVEYSSSTNTNYMMTFNNNNGIMHIFRGDALYIGNNMNTSNQGSGPNNRAISLKTNGDIINTGNITASGYVDSASDIKLKTNIKTIDNALDKVLQLRGAEYDRIDKDNKHEIGVIAQEVEKIIPELVNTNKDQHGEDTKSVSYGNMVAVLIEAIKEQNEVINKMKKEIDDLKG